MVMVQKQNTNFQLLRVIREKSRMKKENTQTILARSFNLFFFFGGGPKSVNNLISCRNVLVLVPFIHFTSAHSLLTCNKLV